MLLPVDPGQGHLDVEADHLAHAADMGGFNSGQKYAADELVRIILPWCEPLRSQVES